MLAIHIPEPFERHNEEHIRYVNEYVVDCFQAKKKSEAKAKKLVRYVDSLEALIEDFFKQNPFKQLVQIKGESPSAKDATPD